MTRFGSEELVRFVGSLNRSSAWACEAVAGVERAIRALLSPPWRPCTARAAFNLATTRRCCVAVPNNERNLFVLPRIKPGELPFVALVNFSEV